jgi:pimeloyl-ACP methyl ester carboxylesterase
MNERTVAAGEVRLRIREWGEPGGDPIFFWHALGDHTGLQVIDVAPRLASEYGARLISLDAPGFGGSSALPLEGYQIPALVDFARSLLEIMELDRVAWMGSSWGAMIGVHFAIAHRDRLSGLVLLDGGYFDSDDEREMSLEELRTYWRSQDYWSFESWEKVDEEARSAFGRWTPSIQEVVRDAYREEGGEIVSIMGPDVYAAAIHGVHEAPPTPVIGDLGRSGVPVLLMAATEPPEKAKERSADLVRFAELVPAAEIHRVAGARHLMLEDAPEEVARAVGEWLRRLVSSPR